MSNAFLLGFSLGAAMAMAVAVLLILLSEKLKQVAEDEVWVKLDRTLAGRLVLSLKDDNRPIVAALANRIRTAILIKGEDR